MLRKLNPSSNFSNPMQFVQQFQKFRQQMAGSNPQQLVNNLLQSGQMTQEQFEQLKSQAQGILFMLGK